MNWWHSLLLLSEHKGNAKDAPIRQKSPRGGALHAYQGERNFDLENWGIEGIITTAKWVNWQILRLESLWAGA